MDPTTPILRTKLGYKSSSLYPSQESTPSDSDEAPETFSLSRRRRSGTIRKSVTAPSVSSFSSTSSSHTHYLEFTSSHDPASSATYSLLRPAILRTLFCENVPPPSTTPSPLTYPLSPSFSPQSASLSGGPLFFGDATTGYTTAYLFRITDAHARGKRRLYAFMALATGRGERAAMRAYRFLAGAFRELAAWVQGLAEEAGGKDDGAGSGGAFAGGERGAGSGSGFGGGGGFAGGRGLQVKARGIAEIVGRPDFFLELHVKFVGLLAQLAVVVN